MGSDMERRSVYEKGLPGSLDPLLSSRRKPSWKAGSQEQGTGFEQSLWPLK